MAWLRDHGVIGNYDDYVALPVAVLDDARMLMAAEAEEQQRQQARAKLGGG
jgi:hypothetical protein